ncbi:response regulator transcription factor [Amphibacillus indicireducens]|uniref:Response regulator transcription factor n=1 Tax=Amphibacillus indicireducens TaxID=1076330 RepID=A0ABP7VSU6_9BACI
MYKVLLIDDEPIIRDGMKQIIDWEQYGFTICGDSANGRDGLELIRTLKPDLAFVDIRMSGMSGIELVEQAKQAGYSGKFVILSGYSSFSYAQELIKLGIHSYLLKPIDEDELVEILIEIKQILDGERLINSELTAYYDLTEEQAWRAVIDGRLEEWQRSVYVKNQVGPFLLTGIKLRKKCKRDQIKNELIHVVSPTAKVIFKDYLIYLLYLNQDQETVEQELLEILSYIQAKHDPDASASLAKEYNYLVDTQKAIDQIADLLDRGYSFSNQQLFQHSLNQYAHLTALDQQQISTKIVQAIEFKDHSLLLEQGEKIIDHFQNQALIKENVQIEMLELVLLITRKIKSQYPDTNLPSKHEWVDLVYQSYNLAELIDHLIEQWWLLTEEINGFVITSDDDSIGKIIAYIDQYYARDLTLKRLSDLFNYNRSYLGKKFRKETGQYFHEYLEEVRIEKAKNLLATSQEKVYVISELVGYSNMDYFYKKFKNHVGKSPKEYQKSLETEMNN